MDVYGNATVVEKSPIIREVDAKTKMNMVHNVWKMSELIKVVQAKDRETIKHDGFTVELHEDLVRENMENLDWAIIRRIFCKKL